LLNFKTLFNHKVVRNLVLVLCYVVYLIFGTTNQVNAQDRIVLLTESIVSMGFENVEVLEATDTLKVFYENRRYRFEPRGLANVLHAIYRNFENRDIIVLVVLLKDRVPLFKLSLPISSYGLYLNGAINGQEFSDSMSASLDMDGIETNSNASNRSLFKADIAVIPNWSAKFGNFDNPVESNINLIPELNSTLAKGLTFKGQIIIPVQNDFFFVAERETIRPGNITLNQFVNLSDNFYLNLTGGFFDKNRAGVNFDVKKTFIEGRFEVGANIGFTSYYSFTGIQTEFYDKQKYLTVLLNTQYRYNPYDLLIRLEIGNYLFNVPAAQFEVLRQFGEVEIGFFAFATKDDYDGGFRFSIPIPPRKYTKLNWFRVRPSEVFSWRYRAKGFPQNGVTYNTGYNLTEVLMDYNPDFVKKRLIIEINRLDIN